MEDTPKCIKCSCEYVYENGDWYVCPECAHEWLKGSIPEEISDELVVKDAYGNILQDGDDVTIIKDIKVKGASSSIKVGFKVKDIRLVTPVNGHNIDAKVKGFGAMLLKSEFVKKCT